MKPLVIYIASPYTIGDKEENVRVQIDAAHRIMDMGHAPITPLLSHYLEAVRPRPYEDWIKADLPLVERADILLRLPGESKGADMEVEHAKKNKIEVVESWEELESHIQLLEAEENFCEAAKKFSASQK